MTCDWPGTHDSLPRTDGEPEDWHLRRTTDDGYPLTGSSPAERAEQIERAARLHAQAMRDHPFEGDRKYCDARIGFVPVGSPEAGYVTGWVGCGYPRDLHPS